jgi:hypothetical protein
MLSNIIALLYSQCTSLNNDKSFTGGDQAEFCTEDFSWSLIDYRKIATDMLLILLIFLQYYVSNTASEIIKARGKRQIFERDLNVAVISGNFYRFFSMLANFINSEIIFEYIDTCNTCIGSTLICIIHEKYLYTCNNNKNINVFI